MHEIVNITCKVVGGHKHKRRPIDNYSQFANKTVPKTYIVRSKHPNPNATSDIFLAVFWYLEKYSLVLVNAIEYLYFDRTEYLILYIKFRIFRYNWVHFIFRQKQTFFSDSTH